MKYNYIIKYNDNKLEDECIDDIYYADELGWYGIYRKNGATFCGLPSHRFKTVGELFNAYSSVCENIELIKEARDEN